MKGKRNFTPVPYKGSFSKPKLTSLLVFDIETVALADDEYSQEQKAYIQKKLTTALARNPDLNVDATEGKIKGTDPYLSRIVCIGIYYPLSGQRLALTNESEKAILESFWGQLAGYNGIFISFNGVRFDVPFIIRRSIYHGLKPSNMSFIQHTKYNPFPPHFDVMLQLGREQMYSLKEACDFYRIPSPKDGSVSSETVGQAFKEGRIKEIAEYCLRDLESTYQLYDKIRVFAANS